MRAEPGPSLKEQLRGQGKQTTARKSSSGLKQAYLTASERPHWNIRAPTGSSAKGSRSAVRPDPSA